MPFIFCTHFFGFVTSDESMSMFDVYNFTEKMRLSANLCMYMGTAVAQLLRCCATNWKVAVSIPDGVIGIFH